MAKKKVEGRATGSSGSAYRKEAGKVGVLLAPTPDERDTIKAAAGIAGKSMAAFALEVVLEAARQRIAAFKSS